MVTSSTRGVRSPSQSVFSRRSALRTVAGTVAGAALVGGFPAIVRAQGTKKFGRPIIAPIGTSEEEPFYVGVTNLKRILAEKYGWEISLVTQAYGTLGSTQGMLVSVQSGFIDIAAGSTGNWSSMTPIWQFMDLPYLFNDWNHAWRTVHSDLYWEIAKKMEQQVPGIKVLPPITSGGFRLLANNTRRLNTPADVRGLKFRSTESPIDVGLIRSWGGNPTPMDWTQTYTAVQQKVVDGIHVQPYWTFHGRFHEVLNNATEVGAIWAFNVMAMNRNTFQSMPEPLQQAYMEAAKEAFAIASEKDRAMEESFKKRLRDGGVDVYKPSAAELAEWRTKGETVWESDAARRIDKEMVQRVKALA